MYRTLKKFLWCKVLHFKHSYIENGENGACTEPNEYNNLFICFSI